MIVVRRERLVRRARRQKLQVVAPVEMTGNQQLSGAILTAGSPGFFFRRHQGWQQQRCKYGNDGNHDQQFNEGKTATQINGFGRHGHHFGSVTMKYFRGDEPSILVTTTSPFVKTSWLVNLGQKSADKDKSPLARTSIPDRR